MQDIKIPIAYQTFVVPSLTFLAILFLSLFGGQFIFGKISEEQVKIEELKNTNIKLEAKKNVLSAQDRQTLLLQTQAAVLAVPGESPALAALSSANSLANENSVQLTDFRVNSKSDKTGTSAQLTLNTEAPLPTTIRYLNDLKNTTPLVKIQEIAATVQGGIARAKITLLSLWSPLPTNLGKSEAPLEPLSSADSQIVQKLQDLKKPSAKASAESKPQGRTNPFSR
jgi:hypothetical protein